MERQRSMKSRLSKQDEFEEVEEEVSSKMVVEVYCADSGGNDGNANEQGQEKVDQLKKCPSIEDGTNSNKDRNDNASLHRQRSKTSSGKHHRLSSSRQSSCQGSLGSLEGSSPALSRDSSIEQYTDSTGTDVLQFIIDTLHKNQKDRMLLLKIEQELINLVKDSKRECFKFSQMSAYQRMIVHRVSAFFGLDHNVDQAGTAVIVNKTKNMRIPDMKFRELIKDELIPDEPKKSILKRDSSSFEEGKEFKSPERQLSSESRRSKSFEEREEEYGKARARIFNQDSSSSQEGAIDSPLRSHESPHNSSQRSSQEDLPWPDPRPWSSTDSDSSHRPTKLVITKTSASTESEPSSSDRLPVTQPSSKKLTKSESADRPSRDTLLLRRGGVPKASSFGGISVLVRADSAASAASAKSASPRLTKAESFSSNSSSCIISAYSDPSGVNGVNNEVASLIKPTDVTVSSTESSTSSATTTVIMASSATSPISLATPLASPVSQNSYHVLTNPNSSTQQSQHLMWAVSNVESVPPGSILINPQTGQPYLNSDGSIYHHNPANPPPLQQFMTTGGLMQQSPILPAQQQQLQQQQPQLLQHQPPPLPQLLPQHPQVQSQQFSHPITLPTQSIAAQSPFVLCNPQPICDQQRHFVQDTSGNSSMLDLSSQLSNFTFSSTPLTAENLMGSEHSMVHANTHSQISQHSFGIPLSVGPTAPTRPSNVLVQHQPTNVTQMPLYLVSSSQPVRFAPPFSYSGSVATQNLPHGLQQSQLLEGHHQQQQMRDATSMSNQLQSSQPPTPTQHNPTPQGYQMQGAQCFPNYPIVGYGQVPSMEPHNLPPYFSVASQSHANISSSGLTYLNPAYTYTVAPLNLPGGGSNGGVQPFNPSQTNFAAGTMPLCGLMPSAGGGGLVSPAAPPVVHPSAYHPPHNAFRPHTPPSQVQGSPGIGIAAGQHQSGPPNLARAYSMTAGVIPSACTSYSHYSPQMVNSPQQPQQCPPLAPPSRTPPQFNNTYPHQVYTNLPMYRQHMLVRPNTPPPPPPPQGIIPSGNGQFATAPLLTKGYSIPGVDQRLMKTSDLYLLDTAVNLSDTKGLLTSSLPNLSNGSMGIRPVTTPMYSRGSIHVPLGQNDMRLIGTPLQHQMQSQVRVPLILTHQRPVPRLQSPQQGLPSGLGRPPKVRRQRSRGGGSVGKMEAPTLSAQSSIDTDRGSHILEVQGLPDGIRKSEAERYLEEVVHHGAKLQFVRNNRSTPESTPTDFVITNKLHVYAVFESETAAQNALLNIKTTKFELRSAGTKPFSDLQAVS